MKKHDAQLVGNALDGDTAAFGELVDRYRDMVYGLSYHLTRNFDDAWDLAQDAFVQAYRKLTQLREPEHFAGWLRQIVLNLYRMQQRQHGVQTEPFDDVQLSAKQHPSASEMDAVVQAALDKLREPERLALTLHYINGYTQAEIGAFLGLQPATIRTRIMRARNHLREEVMAMIEDTFEKKKLSDAFTQVVLQQLTLTPISPGEISVSFSEEVRSLVIGTGEPGRASYLMSLAMKPEDAYAVEDALSKPDKPQAKTHAVRMTQRIMAAFGIELKQVSLLLDENEQCQAEGVFQRGKVKQKLSLRASDALALAVMTQAKLFVNDAVIQKGKVGEDGLQPPFEESLEELRIELQGISQRNRLQTLAREAGFAPEEGKNIIQYRRDLAAGILEIHIPGSERPPVQLKLADFQYAIEQMWSRAGNNDTFNYYDEGMEYLGSLSLQEDRVEARYDMIGPKELPRTTRIG